MLAGFLPGVGTSQIAALASSRRSEQFLLVIGAIGMANILFSFISIWLIGKARSGVAVAASQLTEIGFSEVVLIIAVALIACSIAVVVTLKLSRYFLNNISRVDYALLAKAVIIFIVFMVGATTGVYGLFLLAVCAALGIATKLASIRMSILTAALIIPAIIYYLP